jgi:hypothetical protein
VKRDKRTNNDLKNITQKIKDGALKTGGELRVVSLDGMA